MNVNGFEVKNVSTDDVEQYKTTDKRGNSVLAFNMGSGWFYMTNKNPASYCGTMSAVAKKSKAGAAIATYLEME